jgi:hypothetical protein
VITRPGRGHERILARGPILFSMASGARLSILSIALVAGALLSGCPREPQPPPPGEATPCGDHADCNGGRTCGELALCVGGFCEEEGSVAVPCPSAGTPVPVPSTE